MHGGKAVIPSDVFLAGASLEALSQEGCTVVHGVATMFQALLDHPDAAAHAPNIHLRTGIVAGSSLSRAWIQRLADEFGFTGLAYGYGMTELSCMVFLTDPSRVSLLDDHSSVGALLPHSSARVVDGNFRTLPSGVPGQLLVSGYLVFKGYYKNQEKTEEALIRDAQGRCWLKTGDLVSIDAAGNCVIRGRVKDMIKRGGHPCFTQWNSMSNLGITLGSTDNLFKEEKTSSRRTSRRSCFSTGMSRPRRASGSPTTTGARLSACLSSVQLPWQEQIQENARLGIETLSFGFGIRSRLIKCPSISSGLGTARGCLTRCRSIILGSL